MTNLVVFVDYDNVQAAHTRAGPMSLSRLLVTLIPTSILVRHSAVIVRLYGGWRARATLTRVAQGLVPDIRQGSPSVIPIQHEGVVHNLRFVVELADKPIGGQSALEETLVFDRDLRKFRTKATSLSQCANVARCGLSAFSNISYLTPCNDTNCLQKLGDLLVRDEQKMVDTLIVADMAHSVYVDKANHIAIVSSDTDMWPGVLLALRASCTVVHIHTKPGWRTQQHLLRTIPRQLNIYYKQLSV